MGSYFDSVSMKALQKSLDAVWLRQQTISDNIANAETAGYKSKSIGFESLLSDVLNGSYDSTESIVNEIDDIEPVVHESGKTSIMENGNNVDLDSENIELARAQLQYEYLISALTSQVNRLKYAMNDGG